MGTTRMITRGVWVFVIVLTLGILFFDTNLTIAAPIPPQPVCEVTAKVLDTGIEYSTADTDWAEEVGYERERSGGSKIEIISVLSEVEKGGLKEEDYCENQYLTGDQLIVSSGDDLQTGTTIKGYIQLFGDEFGGWYELEKIQIVSSEDSKEEGELVIDEDSNNEEEGVEIIYFVALAAAVFLIGLFYVIKIKR